MLHAESHFHLFPSEKQLPHQKLPAPFEQREFLCGGEILPWNGSLTEVYSPIYIKEGDSLKRVRLGAYPEMTADAMDKVLQAAHKAFDLGRGQWPTAKVKERIQHIEYGLSTAYTDRVSLTGDSVVLPAADKVGVTVKAATSATSNLMEFKNSSNTVVTAVGPNGWILTIDGGSAA
jgi:hypothetical protein